MMNLIVFVSPILLLILIGSLIRSRGNPETSGRRYFLFLIWVSIGSLVLILLNWIIPAPWLDFAIVLFPIVPGLIVLTLLHWSEWNSLSKRTKILILCAFGILLAATNFKGEWHGNDCDRHGTKSPSYAGCNRD